ncbi:MAG TPA: cyanophycin synthetase, partial [Bacteroidia bacterium]|nr:cyanophycin synthetase [Bacteroidia bacterium]
ICNGKWKTRVENLENIPITFSGRATSMVKNVLPSVLAASLSDISLERIRAGLQTFIASPEQTPGRMNIFHFKYFNVMVDYAHNRASIVELNEFMKTVQASEKIGIITAVGDRRDEDIRNIGRMAAEVFDSIIIRHDKDMRGRSPEEMTDLLMNGIHSVRSEMPVMIIPDELEAIAHAMNFAPKGAFITVFTENVREALAFVEEELSQEQPEAHAQRGAMSGNLRVAS